jgi:hypothetical protein
MIRVRVRGQGRGVPGIATYIWMPRHGYRSNQSSQRMPNQINRQAWIVLRYGVCEENEVIDVIIERMNPRELWLLGKPSIAKTLTLVIVCEYAKPSIIKRTYNLAVHQKCIAATSQKNNLLCGCLILIESRVKARESSRDDN